MKTYSELVPLILVTLILDIIYSFMVNVLDLRTLAPREKGLEKQCRPISD